MDEPAMMGSVSACLGRAEGGGGGGRGARRRAAGRLAWLGVAAAALLLCCSGDDESSGGSSSSSSSGASSSGGGSGGAGASGAGGALGGGGPGGGGSGGGGGSYADRCLEADTLWVAPSGSDSGNCSSEAAACQSIDYALGQASSGQAVCVRAGTYDESWLQVPSGVRLISADGDQGAIIASGSESAVRFSGVSGASLEGFEVHGDWDQGPAGDGLIRVLDASDIRIHRVIAHDAPHDQDCVKVSGQVSGLLIDGLIAYNPGHRTNGYFQEDVDIFGSGATGNDPPPVSDVIVRNSWLLHADKGGDYLIYAKIYVEKIMYENNVFGPSAGGGWGNTAVGVGTSEPGQPDAAAPVLVDAIVRNNIFAGLKGDGALGVMNADNVWIYNNTFWGNSGAELRSVIMLRGNSHPVGATYILDNLFVDNQPSKGGGSFFWVRENGMPSTFELHHNLFTGNVAASDTPYTGEPASLYGDDPLLGAPAVPTAASPSFAMLDQIKQAFGIGSGSPAAGGGVDAVSLPGHPNWRPGETDRRWDYRGQSRPQDSAWDLGADQL